MNIDFRADTDALSLIKAGLSAALSALILSLPAILILFGWRHWQRRTAAMQQWRRVLAVSGLLTASGAWLLLAALGFSVPFLRRVYGQRLIESFWRHSVPVGLLLSLCALPLVLFGRGRVRVYSLLGALALCWWWWFLGWRWFLGLPG